ncbi:MAG: hypothetical protein ACYSTS_11455 [Planctomycetota bacterium]|jgi:tetratricopeptide (TPR) repeat protein
MLKIFTVFLLLFSSILVVDRVSYANEHILKEYKYLKETINSGGDIENFSVEYDKKYPESEELNNGTLSELEKSMKLEIDDDSFPMLFSKYITECMDLNEHKRAKDFFLTLSGNNQLSPHAMTAKGIVTYGWWSENVLKHGLKKIDEAILLDKNAFFPRLCRATYLSYLPNSFVVAINEFNALIEAEGDNPSNLHVVYSNLARMYGEHGHYGMVAKIRKQSLRLQNQVNKKINFSHINEKSFESSRNYNEIIHLPYPIVDNPIAKKAKSKKDWQLNGHLAILEKSMERRLDNATFVDIYKRYTLLTWQYGETNRAVNFFEDLAKRHPRSSNALASLGTITYGWKGQMLLQKGLNCIENAIDLDNNNFFSRLNHATFIAYFPNGFVKSMYEFSLLSQTEEGFPQQLNLIDKRINLICSQHGHDRKPKEYVATVNKHQL